MASACHAIYIFVGDWILTSVCVLNERCFKWKRRVYIRMLFVGIDLIRIWSSRKKAIAPHYGTKQYFLFFCGDTIKSFLVLLCSDQIYKIIKVFSKLQTGNVVSRECRMFLFAEECFFGTEVSLSIGCWTICFDNLALVFAFNSFNWHAILASRMEKTKNALSVSWSY